MTTQLQTESKAFSGRAFTTVPSGLLQRKCAACGNHTVAGRECTDCKKKKLLGLQTKLTINDPGDRYEQEADRIADQVMAMPAHSTISRSPLNIQRFSGESSGQGNEVPESVNRILASSGSPLEPHLRQDMEGRFGYDFSQVRVHIGAEAEQSAQDVNANAYTVGQHIIFSAEQFAPGTTAGRLLIAHELTHTLQQCGASPQTSVNLASAASEADRVVEQVDKPFGASSSSQFGNHAVRLYRQPAETSSTAAPAAALGISDAEFSRRMSSRYGTLEIRVGTEAEQTTDVASRVRQPASAIVLPQWQSWSPGVNSQVYDLLLQSLEEFQDSIGGDPVIREIVFFNTEYDISVNPAGVAIPVASPDTAASFGAGTLTIYRALTIRNKAFPITRSNAQGNYPPVVVGVGGAGQTPGAPLPLPSREESIRRLITHELGHGLAEAAMSVDRSTFDDYRREAGWTAVQPPQLFDIGQQAVQSTLSAGTPPPSQFEITVNNWNSPQWVEQPISDYMVSGGPGEDFAEAVLTFVREPNLLLSRSPHRFQFLYSRKDRWLPALIQVLPVGDFPTPNPNRQVA
jgi:Domain of unknown function (DUF4157)